MSHAVGGGTGRAPARPLRILAIAPGDPGESPLRLVGPHPATVYARVGGEDLRWTILTDEETARRFAGLPSGNELLVAPLWRVLPRSRSVALRQAARLQTGLSCLAALFGELAAGTTSRRWDAVHAWGGAAILPAAAAAHALRVPWAWTPPPDAPRRPWVEGERRRAESDDDEHGAYAIEWAANEAALIVAEDRRHERAIRDVWAPSAARLATLPFGATAGWDREPATPAPSAPGPGAPPCRIAMIAGAGAGRQEVDLVLEAIRGVRRLFPAEILGVGCRQSAAAAAFRAGVRRHDLLSGFAWRDLDPAVPMPGPADAGAGLAGLDVAVIIGRELPPWRLIGALWRQGTAILLSGRALAGDGSDDARPLDAPDLSCHLAPDRPAALADALVERCADRAGRWLACRAAWRALWPDQPCEPEALRDALAEAYGRLATTATLETA